MISPERLLIMDSLKRYHVRPWFLWGGALIILVSLNTPGCINRDFPPIRDSRLYTLELYWVRFSSHIGRQHPDIADVIASRRTKLLKRFEPLLLDIEQSASSVATDDEYGYRAELKQIKNGLATIRLEFDPDLNINRIDNTDQVFHFCLPCDTWGVQVVDVNSRKRTVDGVVLRLNRPLLDMPSLTD